MQILTGDVNNSVCDLHRKVKHFFVTPAEIHTLYKHLSKNNSHSQRRPHCEPTAELDKICEVLTSLEKNLITGRCTGLHTLFRG